MKNFLVCVIIVTLIVVGLITGISVAIENITAPDGVKMARVVKELGLTESDSRAALNLAQASKAQAEADAITATSVKDTLQVAFGMIVCLVPAVLLGGVLLYGLTQYGSYRNA